MLLSASRMYTVLIGTWTWTNVPVLLGTRSEFPADSLRPLHKQAPFDSPDMAIGHYVALHRVAIGPSHSPVLDFTWPLFVSSTWAY